MHEGSITQLRNRLDLLADDVGRLRRRLDPETPSLTHLADRLARHVNAISAMLEPTAAELAAWHAPGQQDAIQEALAIVDARYRALQLRLGN